MYRTGRGPPQQSLMPALRESTSPSVQHVAIWDDPTDIGADWHRFWAAADVYATASLPKPVVEPEDDLEGDQGDDVDLEAVARARRHEIGDRLSGTADHL